MSYISWFMGFWYPIVFTIAMLLSFLSEYLFSYFYFWNTISSLHFFSIYSRITELQLVTSESLETIIIFGNRHHFTTELLLLLLLIHGSSQPVVFRRKNVLKKLVEPLWIVCFKWMFTFVVYFEGFLVKFQAIS